MEFETWLRSPPYGLDHREKGALFEELLTQVTHHHGEHCPEYGRFLSALGCGKGERFSRESVPMLPVSAFKELELRSVPEDQIIKTITSSGTTGQKVSKVMLDAQTATNQQKALCQIVSHWIGPQRLPYLVLDSKKVLRDRTMFSARGAGILGFSIFSSKTCYALDEEMRLDLEGVRAFLEQYRDRPILVFGFTFMVWKHVIRVLEERGERLDIPQGFLLHGGGWKKLQKEAVSPEEFKERVQAALGIRQISSYYGMAEQTGCISLECPYGHLHTSSWSDVILRRPSDNSICERGETGVIQVISPLPTSYPGHSLLTEDLGVLLGEDDCPCGRLGTYFSVIGRIPRAEVRGCSDTYEG